MALVLKAPEDRFVQTTKRSQAEEEEEDLFEINLEAVENIPAPHYYWEEDSVHFVKVAPPNAISATLFANCLLPVSDVSGAIPLPATAVSGKLCGERSLSMLIMPNALIGLQPLAMTLGKLLELPFPGRE